MNFQFKHRSIEVSFQPNIEQSNALLLLEDFIKSPKKYDNQITLSGYAGTGKTSIISIFKKYIDKELFCSVYFSAPTHRANAVTKLKSPDSSVLTLHSLFGLSPTINLEGGNYSIKDLTFGKMMKAKVDYGDLIIIDEASMISDSIYDFLEEYKLSHALKIIYVGDPAQLRPVKSKTISKIFSKGFKIELTKVERTGDNPILEEATNLRNGLDFNYTSKIINNEGVEYINTKDKVLEIIKNNYSSQEFIDNPLYFRILSAKNNQIGAVNKLARQILFDTTEQLVVGDILMAYDNFDINYETKEPLIHNSGDYKVIAIKKGDRSITINNEKVVYNGYYVTLKQLLNIKDRPKNIFIVDLNEDSYKILKFVNEISRLNIQGATYMKQNNRKKAAEYFSSARSLQSCLAFMQSLSDAEGRLKVKKTLDYGYAHSIHRSQGGTYNKILILADTISEPFDVSVIQELKYVALTRASEYVYIHTNNIVKCK